MNSLQSLYRRRAEVIVIGIATLLVMLGMSIDSPTHYPIARIDSSIFLMCGRAWMNGMTPYVDFTDSKGPLLWLIYGIGYLLSPRDYHGVFVVSFFCYWLTELWVYRTALIFVNDRRLALWVALLLLLSFFHPLHYETRVEDYGQLAFVITLYYCSLFCYTDRPVTPSLLRKSFTIIGMGMGALTMMKFTLAAVPVIMVLIMIYVAQKTLSWRNITTAALCLLGGFALSILPFAIYLAANGALGEAIHQYIFVTVSTANGNPVTYLLHGSKRYLLAALGVGLVPILILKRYRYVPLIISLWVYAITTQNANFSYYYNNLNFLNIFPFVAAAIWIERNNYARHWKTASVTAGIVLSLTVYAALWGTNHLGHRIHGNSSMKQQYDRYAYWLGKVTHPRIVYFKSHCHPNCGDVVEALPGCQYWSRQSFPTKKMLATQEEQVRQSKPEFVVVHLKDSAYIAMLQSMGYRQLPTDVPDGPFNDKALYSTHHFAE